MKDKTVRDTELAKTYLSMMAIKAPIDGIVNILPNFRSGGSYGQAPPPFKEGDQAWTGAAIAEIPDMSEMRIELKMEEVDRGKLQARPESQDPRRRHSGEGIHRHARLDQPHRLADLQRRRHSEKSFPARATLQNLDSRLRPGMSATAEIIIER